MVEGPWDPGLAGADPVTSPLLWYQTFLVLSVHSAPGILKPCQILSFTPHNSTVIVISFLFHRRHKKGCREATVCSETRRQRQESNQAVSLEAQPEFHVLLPLPLLCCLPPSHQTLPGAGLSTHEGIAVSHQGRCAGSGTHISPEYTGNCQFISALISEYKAIVPTRC